MEVQEQREQWEEVDGDLEFHYTMVILQKNDAYFHARYNHRMIPPSPINPKVLEMVCQTTFFFTPVFTHLRTVRNEALFVSFEGHPKIKLLIISTRHSSQSALMRCSHDFNLRQRIRVCIVASLHRVRHRPLSTQVVCE